MMDFSTAPGEFIVDFSIAAKVLAALSGFVNATIYLLQGQVKSDEAFLEHINHELSQDMLLQD